MKSAEFPLSVGIFSPQRASSPFRGDVPPETAIFKENFLNIYRKVGIFRYFRNKVGKIRGEIRIWGQVVLIHLNLPPPPSRNPSPLPSRNFVVTPLVMIVPKFRYGVRRTTIGPFYPAVVHFTPQMQTLAKTLGLVESTSVPTNFNKPFFIFLQMPRKYKRKTDRGSWDEEKTKLAIGAVKSKLMDSMKPARASQRQP